MIMFKDGKKCNVDKQQIKLMRKRGWILAGEKGAEKAAAKPKDESKKSSSVADKEKKEDEKPQSTTKEKNDEKPKEETKGETEKSVAKEFVALTPAQYAALPIHEKQNYKIEKAKALKAANKTSE